MLQEFEARLIKVGKTGTVLCDIYQGQKKLTTHTMGRGSVTTLTVRSNEVKSFGFYYCGGEELYRSSILILKDEKGESHIIQSEVENG